MRISLLISTYNRPDALAAVLRSVARQTFRPHEVIIGDDGSDAATEKVIREAAKTLPIRHQWRPHEDFRLALMRNLCASRATGEYLAIIDDDILLHPDFLADHKNAARPGYFVQGSRTLLDEEASREAMAADHFWPAVSARGARNRKNLLRSPLLSRLASGRKAGLRGIRTCNFAVWREDFYRVNGFNEDFVGWGREDSEFVTRLFNAGVERFNLRFAALCCHLFHPPRSRSRIPANDALLAGTAAANAAWCEHGLDSHLGEAARDGEAE
ncbi:MAG: glycosyltransferase family 2 protein [Planctomycetota bacterium]|jgi:glycosyltransferase involved in cell wall biosynthesis|nr:glycosyltransferase family 2 protein [Planctomycetota bacterium]